MEIAALILSTITAAASALAAFLTFLNGRRTAYGNIELQIREMISEAKYRQLECMSKLAENPNNITLKNQLKALDEDVLNAYDEACAKYIDKKVDRERFKKMYMHEIRQLVESDDFAHKYNCIQSRFNATKRVYDEWNNL